MPVALGGELETPEGGAGAWQVPADEVHVWLIDTTCAAFEELDSAALLDAQELDRAQRLAKFDDRLAFVRVHVALRQILAGYLASPGHEIVYEYDCVVCGRRHGKPTVASLRNATSLAFNMARSATLGVVAVAADGPVGVDVEDLDQPIDPAELLEFFAPAEREALSALPAVTRSRDVLLTWTRKEAYSKALGTGLSLALDEFEVSTPPHPPELKRPAATDRTASWTMRDLALPEPYAGTVVAAGSPSRVRVLSWDAPAAGRAGSSEP